MKFLSWNVNGLRAILKKDCIINNVKDPNNTFKNFLEKQNADVVCLTEIRMDYTKNPPDLGYPYNYASFKTNGRAGVLVMSKIKPKSVKTDLIEEGRVVVLEFDRVSPAGSSTGTSSTTYSGNSFYFVGVYVPNSGEELKTLDYRVNTWDPEFYNLLHKLNKKLPVIVAGDLNVVQFERDTKHFDKQRNKVAGVTDLERANFAKLIASGFHNVFRMFYPEKVEYTYFSYKTRGRAYNSGMTIDYFLISKGSGIRLSSIKVLENVYGSDHLPITMTTL